MTENLTATVVAWEDAPVMIENGWEVVAFNPITTAPRSQGNGVVLMKKNGNWDTRRLNGMQKGIRSKRGESNGE